ncbi:unnamed protein product, partial [Cylicocyclus nassatus]
PINSKLVLIFDKTNVLLISPLLFSILGVTLGKLKRCPCKMLCKMIPIGVRPRGKNRSNKQSCKFVNKKHCYR